MSRCSLYRIARRHSIIGSKHPVRKPWKASMHCLAARGVPHSMSIFCLVRKHPRLIRGVRTRTRMRPHLTWSKSYISGCIHAAREPPKAVERECGWFCCFVITLQGIWLSPFDSRCQNANVSRFDLIDEMYHIPWCEFWNSIAFVNVSFTI